MNDGKNPALPRKLPDARRRPALSARTRKFIRDGVVLTMTSLSMRALGVGFQSFLSKKIGAEGLGLYTLIMSVYGFAVTVASSGLNLATTRLCAGAKTRRECRSALRRCLAAALVTGTASALGLFFGAGAISEILGDERCCLPLRCIGAGMPFIALSSVIHGYFAAIRKSSKSAATQVIEQLFRIAATTTALLFIFPEGTENACLALVCGGAVSEAFSLLTALTLYAAGERRAKKSRAGFPSSEETAPRQADISANEHSAESTFANSETAEPASTNGEIIRSTHVNENAARSASANKKAIWSTSANNETTQLTSAAQKSAKSPSANKKSARSTSAKKSLHSEKNPSAHPVKELLSIIVPVAAAAYARSALTTIEHILIPRGLRKNPLTAASALASYGVLCGMALPVVMLPTAFLYSFTGLLIPEFAEADANGDTARTSRVSAAAVSLAAIYAVGCAGFLWSFSDELGTLLYSSADAGAFIRALAPLVPMMYIDHTVDAMLKGLGEQLFCMKVNIADAALSVILVSILCGRIGIYGWVVTIWITEILNASLSVWRLVRRTKPRIPPSLTPKLIIPLAASLLTVFALPENGSVLSFILRAAAFCGAYFLTAAIVFWKRKS